jgi:flagellin
MKVQNLTQKHINNHLQKIQKDLDKTSNPNVEETVNKFVNDVFQNDIDSNLQEINNYNDAIGFTQIANGALNSIRDNLHNIKTLQVASNNATLNNNNLNALNSQIQKYAQNINETLKNTTYNNKNVFGNFQFNDININTSMPDFDIDNLDEFEKSLNNAFSSIGAAQNALTDKINNLSQNIISKSAAKAQNEPDMTKKFIEMQNEKIKLNVSILAQAHQNSLNVEYITSLLRD